MVRRCGFLLSLAALASAQDAKADKEWKEFFNGEVRPYWADAEQPASRVLMIRKFKKHDHPDAARFLIDAIEKDSSAYVLRESLKILKGYTKEATVAAMAEAWKAKSEGWQRKAISLQAFSAIRRQAALEPIHMALASREPGMVVAGCIAAGVRKHPDFRTPVQKHLRHKTAVVRISATQAIAEMRAEAFVPDLFRLFCGDPSHRVRFEAWRAITQLTLEDFGFDPTGWKKWYDEQVAAVPEGSKSPWGRTLPVVKSPPKPAYFFTIPVFGDRICFVIDASADMDNAWKIDVAAERKKKPPEQTPNFYSVKTRWQLATAQLKRCLNALPSNTKFCCVFYYNKMKPWPPDQRKFVKNTPKARDKLFKFMAKEVERKGSTDMGEAFNRAIGFLKEGNPKTNFIRGCDTIVFLTDGMPTWGDFKNKPDEVRDLVWRAGVTRRLQVHTVGLYNHAFELLKALALDSGGLYVHAQEPNDTAEPQDLDFWPEKKKAFEAARKGKKQ